MDSKVPTPIPPKRCGPPRYFVPVCIRRECGYLGGPSGYEEVTAEEADRGPIIIKAKENG